jgi:ankyrin repeat protein
MAILCGNEANGKPGTVVQTLLELGANVNQAATDGWTPLHMAAASFHNNKYPVFRLIMDAKPDVNAKTKDGLTPLHVAAMSAHVAYQQKPDDSVNRALDLIKAGADLEATDDNGRTPLIWAAMQGAQSGVAVSDFMVKALLDAKAKVDARDNIGRMALHYAAEQGYDGIVAALLQAGAKTDVKDNDGKSPADLATARALASTLQVLKAPPAAAPAAAPGIAALATPAKTPSVLGAELVRATRAGNVEEVKSLLARGADVTFRDSDGFSALDRARDLGNAEILKMLQDAEKKQPAPAANSSGTK